MFLRNADDLGIAEVVREIISFHARIEAEWTNSYGWAPRDAAQLLATSRLDWLTSLARTLELWIDDSSPVNQHDARLILAWVNLGALVEGSMKFLLSIHVKNYKDDVQAKKSRSIFKNLWDEKRQKAEDPDGLMLDRLREFFRQRIWNGCDSYDWNAWVERIRNRRNAIHAYQDKDIGTPCEFREEMRMYLRFIDEVIDARLPEPPDHSVYQ